MKKFLVITLAACVLMTTAGFATFALVNANKSAANTFTYGNVKISLSEKFENAETVIMPGVTVKRDAAVTNEGNKGCFVRIRVNDKFVINEPRVMATMSGGNINASDCSYKFAGSGWVIKDDGYAYYDTLLKPGEKTKPISISAVFSNNLNESLSNSQFATGTKAFAVQSDNNPIPDGGTVADIKGWPEDN